MLRTIGTIELESKVKIHQSKLMYPYQAETQSVIRGMIEACQSFDIEDIKALTETVLEDDGRYYDPIVENDLKSFILALFEKGHIPGYYLLPKYVCDNEGPKVTLEFVPEDSFGALDLIDRPDYGKSVKCNLHKGYKDLLEYICKKANCSQDMMVRSILVKALDEIKNHLK